jgi:response regulator RpfG family c-di-GMP phosphodiesterase
MQAPLTNSFDLSVAARLDGTLDRANSDVVLIVDDVPDNLSVLHDALDESGYTVLIATSGEAALMRAMTSRGLMGLVT